MIIRDEKLYIEDILEAIIKIEKYIVGYNLEKFEEDEKTSDAVIRNFEVIGEATKKVSDELRSKYSDLPWKEMAGMRDKLIHNYFGIHLEVVYLTATEFLPELKVNILKIIKKM